MNIRKEHLDALNAVVKITIGKYEYTEKIENFLELKRKTATLPGFRKGKTPMDVVRKQFEKPAIIEEVTALVNKGLKDYIAKEKLDLLGNALPRTNENFDWNADELVFEYELGIAPEFSVDLARASGVTKYKIIADETLLNEQVERIQKQYGKILTETEVKNGFEINGTFSNEEKNISNQALIGLDVFADAKTGKQFIGKKVGDVILPNFPVYVGFMPESPLPAAFKFDASKKTLLVLGGSLGARRVNQLIEKIYIHPKSENWYKNLVIELVQRLGFDFKIEKSDLESDILI
mgnify:CR=1 FL=1